MFMTAIACVATEIVVWMTSTALRIVVLIKLEIGGMIECRRNPFAGIMTFTATIPKIRVN
jgi:hypothetical protein